jgi:hypothetical protein
VTPEEFDAVYFELAQALRRSVDAHLYRDRLLLMTLARLELPTALETIAEAEPGRPLSELKQAAPEEDVPSTAHS